MNDILDFVNKITKNKKKYVQIFNNMNHYDVLRLRNEAAESGVEMSPDEVYSCLNLIKDIVFDT